MLTPGEAGQMERWIEVARHWGESSQSLVGLSTDFSRVSRDLADRLDRPSGPPSDRSMREDLAGELRNLAGVVEEQMRTLRDDYLATAATLEELGSGT